MRWCLAVIAVGLLCGRVGLSKAPQQSFALEMVTRASQHLVISPQLLLYLSRKGADKDVLQALRRVQEQQLLAELPLGKEGEFPRYLQELLQQVLSQVQNEQLANFNTMQQQNVWEAMTVFDFTYDISNDVQFWLDSQYGTQTLVSNIHDGSVGGFGVIDPQQSRVFDFSSITAVDIEQDFLTLPSLPPPVFTPRHYVFHGEQYLYVINRNTLELEYVGQSETEIDEQQSFAHRIHSITTVNDSLLAVRYKNANNSEFVQLIDLNRLATVHAQEINGELVAISPRGDLLATQNHHQLQITDVASGHEQIFLSGVTNPVQFSPDSQQLAYIDGNTLYLIELMFATFQLPQRIKLNDEQTIISATQTNSQLLWDKDSLYAVHDNTLYHINHDGEIEWKNSLTTDTQALQTIDAQHLALFSEQGMSLYHKENGSLVLQLVVDKKQRLANYTFADRYLSLLLEDRLHLDKFNLTLTRIPLSQLLQLLAASPLLQEIAATEKFTLQKGNTRFAELVLSAIEQYLQHEQVPINQLVQLLYQLYQAYHLAPGSFYVAPNISNLLTQHTDEVTQLSTDNPAFAKMLQKSFL